MTRLVLALALRAVRALLRLHPPEFRRRFAADVESDVRGDLEAAAARGPGPVCRAAGRAIADAIFGLWVYRRRPGAGRAVDFPQDLRVAWRRIRADRGPMAIVGLTFVVSIASAVAIFSVAEAALLRPLPYPDGERLVRLEERPAVSGRAGVSIPAFDLWRTELPSLESVAFYEARFNTVVVDGSAERLSGAGVSREIFDVLGVRPARGRPFTPGSSFGAPDEAVISHRLWLRLGGTEAVVGSALQIDPRPYTIVGVMPPGFDYPGDADYWVTTREMGVLKDARDLRFLDAVGRLTPGASLQRLQSELAVVDARYPETDRTGGAVHMAAFSVRDAIVGAARPGLRIALAGAVLLLVLACCNISALVLARTCARNRTFAVQRALGASGSRLAAQSVLEVALVTVPCGAAGTAVAWLLLDVLTALERSQVPGVGPLAINGRVLAFAGLATIVSSVAAAVVPAVISARADAVASLRARSAAASPGILALLRGLIVAQVALGFVVAVCAALLGRSVARLAHAERGFDAAQVATARINLPLREFREVPVQLALYDRILERARSLPGVRAVGLASRLPLAEAIAGSDVSLPDAAAGSSAGLRAELQVASRGYLAAIGARLLAGADFDEHQPAEPSVVINDVLAARLFPDGGAIGRRDPLQFHGRTEDGPRDRRRPGASL